MGSVEKWLRLNDTNEWYDQYHPENQADLLRFFDHYLKGKDNGWEKTPRARLSILDAGGEDSVNVPFADWPVPETGYERLHLNAADGTLSAGPLADSASVSYDATSGATTFTLVVDHDLRIAGYIRLRLWLESEGADDMDVFVLLEKCDAAGTVLVPAPAFADAYAPLNPSPGSSGRVRVSRRALDAARSTEFLPVPTLVGESRLQPGQRVSVDIALQPVAMEWHAGQQLRLTIAGYHLGRWPVPTTNDGMHIIHTGTEFPSWLQIPVLPSDG